MERLSHISPAVKSAKTGIIFGAKYSGIFDRGSDQSSDGKRVPSNRGTCKKRRLVSRWSSVRHDKGLFAAGGRSCVKAFRKRACATVWFTRRHDIVVVITVVVVALAVPGGFTCGVPTNRLYEAGFCRDRRRESRPCCVRWLRNADSFLLSRRDARCMRNRVFMPRKRVFMLTKGDLCDKSISVRDFYSNTGSQLVWTELWRDKAGALSRINAETTKAGKNDRLKIHETVKISGYFCRKYK